MVKKCSVCKITKPVSEFYPSIKSFDGLLYRCKSCNLIASSISYSKKKEYYNARKAQTYNIWRKRNPDKWNAIKRRYYQSHKHILCKKLQEKARKIKQAKEYMAGLSKKEIRIRNKRRQPYLNAYYMERYHADPEFRKNQISAILRWQKKTRAERKKMGLCSTCGKKLKDKDYVKCLACRIKKRKK